MTVDLPECQEPPLLPKKTVDFGTVDLPECQEQRRQAQKHKKVSDFFLTTVFLGRGGGVLDIRGRSTVPKSTVFLGRDGGFLTLGKVNGAKIDRFFFGRGGGFLTLGKVNGAKIDRFFFFWEKNSTKNRCQNRPFFGRGGFRSKSRLYPTSNGNCPGNARNEPVL